MDRFYKKRLKYGLIKPPGIAPGGFSYAQADGHDFEPPQADSQNIATRKASGQDIAMAATGVPGVVRISLRRRISLVRISPRMRQAVRISLRAKASGQNIAKPKARGQNIAKPESTRSEYRHAAKFGQVFFSCSWPCNNRPGFGPYQKEGVQLMPQAISPTLLNLLTPQPVRRRHYQHNSLSPAALDWFKYHFDPGGFNGRFQIGFRRSGEQGIYPLYTGDYKTLGEFLATMHVSKSLDYYITANSFNGVERKAESLFGLHNIVVDVDLHTDERLSVKEILEFPRKNA